MANNQLESVKSVFERDDIKQRFFDMLGKESTGFMISVIDIVSNNEMLSKADRNSILFAAATAATMRLPVNPNLGFAYIVPYKGKDGIVKAQFQMGYKGFIQLAQRSGLFKTIAATPVYEGQLIEKNPLTGYVFDFTNEESVTVVGYASYFELLNGFSKTFYMPIEALKKHGKLYSQSYKKGFGLWEDNFDAMATKTVIKLLLSKFAPLSVEMQRAIVSDQAVLTDWDDLNPEYPDNKQPTAEQLAEEKENQRVNEWIKNAKTLKELEEPSLVDYIEKLSDDDETKLFYQERFNLLKKK